MKKILLSLLLLIFSAPHAFAAANLNMLSATLAADGVTFTIPFTVACQSPLSPASGILGFTVNVSGGWSGSITSATRFGCTVNLVMSEPISKDETPTITLASTTGANFLTDSSGNTPAGQSSFAVTNNSEWLETSPSSGTLTNKYRAEGMGHPGSPNYDSSYIFQTGFASADGCYRINATATQIDLWAFQYSNHWVLRQDGVQIHDWGLMPNTVAFAEQGLITGLSGAHEYDFCAIGPQNNGAYLAIMARVRITGTIGAQPTAKNLIFAGGDSITAYYGAPTIGDSTNGDLYQIATNINQADQFWGAPGDQLCSSMQTEIPMQLGYITETMPLLTVAGSTDYNDHSAGTSASAVGVCMDTLLTNIDNLSNKPAHVLVFGNLPFAAGNLPSSYDTALAAAVALHPRACFVSRLNWINTIPYNAITAPTGDRAADAVHVAGGSLVNGPAVGYAKLANREIPIAAGYINGASFSVSGPSSGKSGTQSTNFIITAAAGSTFNGDSITLNDSGAGGTFTPNLTSLTSGASSVTFTYTPATTGAISISYSGLDSCWTAPTANSYNSFSFATTSVSARITGGAYAP